MKKQKTFLFAILNWGLGHATRCMPVIDQLLQLNQKIIIASDGLALSFLKDAYPTLSFETLPAYNIHYPKFGSMVFSMFKQLPHLIKTIKKSNAFTATLIQKHKVDCIISDNRYGCYNENVHTIFITHQTNIQLPKMLAILNAWVNSNNHKYINCFKQLWIPDYDKHLLSGNLSYLKNNIKATPTFIGPLSRLKPSNKSETNFCTIILSGPEPQRSILEQKIINQAKLIKQKIILVRGTKERLKFKQPTNVEIVNVANSLQVNKLLLNSKYIICRSGYSSIMDLVALQQTALLIPTPGQTEQEYLAKHLSKQQLFVTCPQSIFSLRKAIEKLKNFVPDFSQIDSQLNYENKTLEMHLKNQLTHLIEK